MYKLAVLTIVAVAVNAIPAVHGHGHEEHHHVDYYTEPHYSFHYEVKDPHTKDIKSHKEERKGDHTKGVYWLIEPDGSKRVVEYVVEGKKGGFLPKVHREHNKHPEVHHHHKYEHEHHSGHGEATSHSNYNIHGGHVHEVIYHTKHDHHESHSGGHHGYHH